MRTPLVVIVDPLRDLCASMIEAEEPALVEKLVAHAPVEALTKAVLMKCHTLMAATTPTRSTTPSPDCRGSGSKSSNTRTASKTSSSCPVERTLSWFGRYRRLAKDYKNLTDTLAAFVTLAAIQFAIIRLARA